MDMNTEKLNKRQDVVLSFIERKGVISVGKIMGQAIKEPEQVARMTISRDLEKMLKLNLIQRQGAGRSVTYQLSPQYSMLRKLTLKIFCY